MDRGIIPPELQAGLDQLDRGEGIGLEDQQALRAFFDDIKARGRRRLGARQAGPRMDRGS